MTFNASCSHKVGLAVFIGITSLLATLPAGCSNHEKAKAPPPPTEVVVVKVEPKTVPAIATFVAQIQSSHQIDIMARVSGFLERICYKEGEPVRKGQVLFKLDKKPFEAAVSAARAELDTRKSQLWTAKATLDRIKPLAAQNAASKSDLDNATGNYMTAQAGVHQAQANLDKALLDLSYTTITLLVSGVASQSLIREGAYVAAGSSSAKLTYVAKLDPAWVDFSVSQNQQASLMQEVDSGQVVTPKDQRYTVEVDLSDGKRYPQTGVVDFADPSFSKDTGTFLVRAVISNPKGVLRPGMFVKAYMKGAVRPNALAVPQRAVQQTSNGHVVFVVNDKGQAEARPVMAGDWIDSDWIIKQGLKGGEMVIVDGFMKLAPGMPVKVVSAEEMKAAQQKLQQQPKSSAAK
ncbi:MAG TPA: efflux RND transporter periplasmic adaptor subunit [Deltaproteobacteria bacterium]|nr:efflux RND transporter periplasmic adaptor subunit [Deltaproteobacteria bacterium]